MTGTDLLWGAGIAAFAAAVGYGVYWLINRGDPHQRPWKD